MSGTNDRKEQDHVAAKRGKEAAPEANAKQNKDYKRCYEMVKHLTTSANWSDFGISRALLKVTPSYSTRNVAKGRLRNGIRITDYYTE